MNALVERSSPSHMTTTTSSPAMSPSARIGSPSTAGAFFAQPLPPSGLGSSGALYQNPMLRSPSIIAGGPAAASSRQALCRMPSFAGTTESMHGRPRKYVCFTEVWFSLRYDYFYFYERRKSNQKTQNLTENRET